MTSNHNYRSRIYPQYTSHYTPQALELDEWGLQANALPLLARLERWLPNNLEATCLDVACGAGGLLFALRSKGYGNLCGVDCSAQQVSVAQNIVPAVEQDDAIAYLLRHQSQFDLITAFDIIEHFDKNEVFEFLDALYAALTPGGRLIVQTPNADSPWFGSVRYGDFTHELAFTPESLARVLKTVGFEGFEAQECGSFFHGLKSGVRCAVWRIIRVGLICWNLVETGSPGSSIFTRVFIAKADKPA